MNKTGEYLFLNVTEYFHDDKEYAVYVNCNR